MTAKTATLVAARRAHDLKERKLVEGEPLVRAVLERFPGAEIVYVARRNPEEINDTGE